jgi:ABC-type polysaccharide/polyol phosphate export permease
MVEIIVIEPGRSDHNYWVDLWRYRELFRVLAWRDLAVRYKQTVVGAAWAMIRPLLLCSSLPLYLAASPGRQSQLYLSGLGISICVAIFFLWLGIHKFRSMEKSFADLI